MAGLNPGTTDVTVACSSYLDVVYAALADQGVALGWRRIVGDLVDQGQLVAIAPPIEAPEGYHLVTSRRPRAEDTLRAFVDWVTQRAAAEER
jgi:DNA-binding transcriptional LysR family regulator